MPALKNPPPWRDNAVRPLAVIHLGIFFYPEQGLFPAVAKDGKHGAVLKMIDCVIAPLAGRHHAPIAPENFAKFLFIKNNRAGALFCGPDSWALPVYVSLF